MKDSTLGQRGETLASRKSTATTAPPVHSREVPEILRRPSQRQRLGVWALCVVIASLLPIVSALGEGSVQAGSPGLIEILSRGDLYLIGAVIIIAGVGDLGLSMIFCAEPKVTALYVLIPGVVLAILEGILYAQVASQLLSGKSVAHAGQVAMISFIAFLSSAALSGVGVYM